MEAGFWFLRAPANSYSRPRATRPTSGVHGEARGAATRGQAAAYRAHGSPRAVPCPSACSSGQQVGHAHRNRPWGCLGARWPRLGQPSVAVPYDPTHTQGRVLVASSSPGEPNGPLGWLLRLQGAGNRPYWRPKRPCHFRVPLGCNPGLRYPPSSSLHAPPRVHSRVCGHLESRLQEAWLGSHLCGLLGHAAQDRPDVRDYFSPQYTWAVLRVCCSLMRSRT